MLSRVPGKLLRYPFTQQPGGYTSYLDIAIQIEWYDAEPDIRGVLIEPSYAMVRLIRSFISRLDIPCNWLMGILPVTRPIGQPDWTYEDAVIESQIRHRNLMCEIKMAAAQKSLYYRNTRYYLYCFKFKKLIHSRKHVMLIKITKISNTRFKYIKKRIPRKTGKGIKLQKTKILKRTIPIGPKVYYKQRKISQFHYLNQLIYYRTNNFNVFGNPHLTEMIDVREAYQLLKYTYCDE